MLLIELIIRADLDYYEESSVGLQSSEQGKSIDYVSTNNNTSFITGLCNRLKSKSNFPLIKHPHLIISLISYSFTWRHHDVSICRYLWWVWASWVPYYSAHHELSSIVVWGQIHIHRGKLAGKCKRGLKSTGDSQFSSYSTAELKAVYGHVDTANGQPEAPYVGVIFWNFCHKVNAD
jgi:hypothetical protein